MAKKFNYVVTGWKRKSGNATVQGATQTLAGAKSRSRRYLRQPYVNIVKIRKISKKKKK